MSGYMKKKHSKLVASKRESSGSDSDSSDYGSKRAEEVHQIPNVEDEHQRPNIGNFFDEALHLLIDFDGLALPLLPGLGEAVLAQFTVMALHQINGRVQ